MGKKRLHSDFDKDVVARRKTIWDRGPLGLIPNRYLRRPLKALPIVVTLPSMLWRSRHGPIEGLRLPDFIGIGAPRTGTSWLYQNLRTHPDICMPDVKEQRFWDHNLSRGIDTYAARFACEPYQVSGEISPTYSVMDRRRIKLMARLIPGAKLIYLIRNPIHRTWSHFSFWAHNHGLDPEKLSDEEVGEILTSNRFTRPGTYTQVYELYRNAFPSEQIFVGFYDDLEAVPRQLLTDVFQHLGVNLDVDWDRFPIGHRVNAGKGWEQQRRTTASTMPEKWRSFLAFRFEVEMQRSARTFGGHAEEWAAAATEPRSVAE